MLPTLSRRSPFFSRDIQRVMHEFDDMFGTIDEMFHEPFSLQRISRPSYLLQGPSASNALAPSRAKASYGITQDDKQLQIAVEVPGAKASDINLQLEDDGDGHLLRISGETKREEGGISVHSRFDKSFTLSRNVDTAKISAKMENGILTINAPKFEEAKETVRKIDVVENEMLGSGSGDVEDKVEKVEASLPQEQEEIQKEAKAEIDDSVIDLDEKND